MPPTLLEALEYVMPFGKHRGKPLQQIWREEPDYMRKFLRSIELREPLKSHVNTLLVELEKK